MKNIIPIDRIRELLTYDDVTGIFVWNVRRPGMKFSVNAGYNRKDGRREITIDGKGYLAHRVAYAHFYGVNPSFDIDHIDGNPMNNAISNLRDVEKTVNLQNQRKPHSNNKSGLMGVSANGSNWAASIRTNRERKYLGTFKTCYEAGEAYQKAKMEMHSEAIAAAIKAGAEIPGAKLVQGVRLNIE